MFHFRDASSLLSLLLPFLWRQAFLGDMGRNTEGLWKNLLYFSYASCSTMNHKEAHWGHGCQGFNGQYLWMRWGMPFVGVPSRWWAQTAAVLSGCVRCDHGIAVFTGQMQRCSSVPCSQPVIYPGTGVIIIYTLLLVNILTFLTHYPLGQLSSLNNIADNYSPGE